MTENAHPENESLTIAVRIPSWLGYGREMYQGIASYVTEKNLKWQIQTEVDTDGELMPYLLDDSWHGDGVIFFRYTDEEIEALKAKNCPVVSTSRISEHPWVTKVHADNEQIGRLAAEHLIATGAPNLACWIDPERVYCRERLKGFMEVAKKYHREVQVLECIASLYPPERKWSIIREEMKQQLQQLSKPTAIMARDDIAAAGLIKVALELGIEVPNELTVLGVGNDPVLSWVTMPTMSTVEIPVKEIGWYAAKMLHERIKSGKKNEDSVNVPVHEIIKRDSTRIIHTSDELVAKACNLIRLADPEEPATVRGVCGELGVSATTLLKRFQSVMHCSPKQFIDRSRFEEACRVLGASSSSIKSVAYSLGFKSPEEFDRFFKRHAGVTPSAYREKR